jgi:HEAT repeat protein
MHCPKNTWYMRDVLEDALQANLPAAAPLLRAALKDEDAEVRQSAALVLVRAGLEVETALPFLMENLWTKRDGRDEQWRFQRRVVELLIRRQKATPAVAAAWCKAWRTADPKVREVLEPGLLVLQPEALPHLLDQLRQAKNARARRDLAHLLARFEGQGQQIVPILREELRESQPADQNAAARALALLGPDAVEAVPDLVRLLSSPHPGIRTVGAKALTSIGRAARPAVPSLKAMLKEDKPLMRVVAAGALSQIDPDVSEALTVLRDALVSEKSGALRPIDFLELPESVKDRYVYLDPVGESIARFGERAVPVLADLLDNGDLDEWSADNLSAQCGANARVQAALLLAKLGPEAKAAVPALVRALKDRDPFIRDAAASALGRIGSAAQKAAPEFIALLEQQNRFASAGGTWSSRPRGGGRFDAASRFGYEEPFNFRSAGRGKVLYEGFTFGYGYDHFDPYARVRPPYPHDPAHVLSRIDSEARSALPILREMAKDANHPRRLSAALALWRTGCEAPDLIPAFTAALEMDAKINKQAIRAPLNPEAREYLAELGPKLKPAARVMAEWLSRRQSSAPEEDQVAVVEALGRLGADAHAEADLLRPMLHGDRWNAKRRAAVALALFRIRGDKDLVFPVLREVLFGLEEHPSVYQRVDVTDTARVHAARGLGVLAENGDERAQALIFESAKGDENPHVRVAALEALARQKQTNAAAMNGLCAMLRHPDGDVRFAVASACGRLGPLAKLGVKALKGATEDGQLAVRQAARQALEFLD